MQSSPGVLTGILQDTAYQRSCFRRLAQCKHTIMTKSFVIHVKKSKNTAITVFLLFYIRNNK